MQTIHNIWEEFHRELRSIIVQKTQNAADADDILQDIFMKIIQHQEKVMGANNIKNYIFGIARNVTNDYFQKRKHSAHETLSNDNIPDNTDTGADNLNMHLADCCMHKFIQQLPDKYREAIVLTELQDMPQKVMAEQLNISYSGAKSRVQRGKEQLRELLMECCAYKSDRYGNILNTDPSACTC